MNLQTEISPGILLLSGAEHASFCLLSVILFVYCVILLLCS